MNTITHKFNGVTRINMSDHAIKGLRSYSPQGRPFVGYTFDFIDICKDKSSMTEKVKKLESKYLNEYY